ncbi:uncharacterized protein [Haliotis asinina]|uniref:uncharacterized protein n=1 Tax=Haliotis asinina TaxID=109174 RepID=UPI003532346D
MADRAAKAALNKSVTPLLIPYADYKACIRTYIRDLMQKKWDTQNENVILDCLEQGLYRQPPCPISKQEVLQTNPDQFNFRWRRLDKTDKFDRRTSEIASGRQQQQQQTPYRDISTLNRIIYTTVLFSAAFATTTTTLIGVTLPDIQCLLGVDLKTASSLLFAYGFGMCCSNLTVHFIKDKVDTCLFLASTLVLNAVVIAAIPASTFLWLTVFLIFIAGWCTGICVFIRTSHCFVIWPDSAFVVSLVQAGASLNTISIPFVSDHFRHNQRDTGSEEAFCNTTTHLNSEHRCNNFSMDYYTFIIISGLSLLVASCLMGCYNTILKKGEVMEVPPPVKRKAAVNRSTSPMLMCLTMCFNFACCTCTVSFQELFVTFGICTQLNLSLSDMSVMYSAFSSAVLLSRLLSVVLSARLSLDIMMVLFLSLSGVTSVLFLIFMDTSIIMMWTNSLLFAVGMAPLFPGCLAWVKENSDGSPRFLNMVLFSDFTAFLVSPAMCGLVMGMIGANAFVYMVSGAGLLQCVLFMFMCYDKWIRKLSNNRFR